MPALEFEQLPAGATNIEGQQSQTIDPIQGIKNQYNSDKIKLESEYKRDRSAMAKEIMTNVQWNNRLAKLNLKYQTKLDELTAATNKQVSYIQQIHKVAVDKRLGEEQALRAYLKPEAEAARFPKPETMPQPYSASRIKSEQQLMGSMLEAVKEPGYIRGGVALMKGMLPFIPYKKATVDKDELITTYKNWQEQTQYHFKHPLHKAQLDRAWDMYMKSDPKYANWFTYFKDKFTHGPPIYEVRTLRSRGPGTTAIQQRMMGTPLGSSVSAHVKHPLQRIKLDFSSPEHRRIANEILEEANKDKNKAREIARQKGYDL